MNDDKEFLTFEEALKAPGLYSLHHSTNEELIVYEFLLVIDLYRFKKATVHENCAKALWVHQYESGDKWILGAFAEKCGLVDSVKYKLHKTQHLEFSITLKQNEE